MNGGGFDEIPDDVLRRKADLTDLKDLTDMKANKKDTEALMRCVDI
jgi:hypothetical protein